MNHLVIMAGGVGSRFWPMSTPEKPKQFIDVLGVGRTLIQLTVDRFSEVCDMRNVWVVTSEHYRDLVREQLPQIPESNILLEPCMRNTAPCVAYVAWKIKKQDPEANLVISAADHIVMNVPEFVRVIRRGLVFTEKENRILTLGMLPTRPETGYGYIKVKEEQVMGEDEIKIVEGFKEKPDLQTAEKYLQEGGYYWNAGIFLWNVKTVEWAFRENQPEMAALFDTLDPVFYTDAEQTEINRKFPDCPSISVDYAIMEHARNIYVFPASFGWSDLGTWGSLYEQLPKDPDANAVVGKQVRMVESTDCVVHVSGDKRMVLQGLNGYIVAEQDNVFLICRKADEQRIKEFSSKL
ncbi:MAG: mannose-1-phosphate guanylyltransferase [Odoribacter splanchnicus]|nr:mannose-1-phosphate guanylyltransferase [Odoribacter splanchnicus]